MPIQLQLRNSSEDAFKYRIYKVWKAAKKHSSKRQDRSSGAASHPRDLTPTPHPLEAGTANGSSDTDSIAPSTAWMRLTSGFESRSSHEDRILSSSPSSMVTKPSLSSAYPGRDNGGGPPKGTAQGTNAAETRYSNASPKSSDSSVGILMDQSMRKVSKLEQFESMDEPRSAATYEFNVPFLATGSRRTSDFGLMGPFTTPTFDRRKQQVRGKRLTRTSTSSLDHITKKARLSDSVRNLDTATVNLSGKISSPPVISGEKTSDDLESQQNTAGNEDLGTPNMYPIQHHTTPLITIQSRGSPYLKPYNSVTDDAAYSKISYNYLEHGLQPPENIAATGVHDLSWDELRRLRDAADAFTACRMYVKAFELHFLIWRRLKREAAKRCCFGLINRWRIRQLLACLRTAVLERHRKTAWSMRRAPPGWFGEVTKPQEDVLLYMLVADLHVLDGEPAEAHMYRGVACFQLPSSQEPRTRFSPHNLVSSHAMLRGYSLMRSAKQNIPRNHEQQDLVSHEEDCLEGLKHIWEKRARASFKKYQALFKWCHGQLRTLPAELLSLVKVTGNTQAGLNLERKEHRIVLLFGLLLGRLYTQPVAIAGTEFPWFNMDSGFTDSKRCAVSTSNADILWVLSTVIESETEDSSVGPPRLDDFLKYAADKAADLAISKRNHLLDCIYGALTSGALLRHDSNLSKISLDLLSPERQTWPAVFIENVAAMAFGVAVNVVIAGRNVADVLPEAYHPTVESEPVEQSPAGIEVHGDRAPDTSSASVVLTTESDVHSTHSSMKEFFTFARHTKKYNEGASKLSDSSSMSELIRETWYEHLHFGASLDSFMSEAISGLSVASGMSKNSNAMQQDAVRPPQRRESDDLGGVT